MEFFTWSAPDGCHARKRQLQAIIPLPHVKRQRLRLLGSIFPESGEEINLREAESCVQFREEVKSSCLYPSVVYESDIARVKLGVGQTVMLEGCAMVQVVEGHAAMLGYSFPRGTDVFVCSSSKLITIDAGRGNCRGSDALGCELRLASHTLGQQQLYTSGARLSFRLELIGSLGSSLGKQMGQQFWEQQNQVQDRIEDNDGADSLDIDGHFAEDTLKKRKNYGQNMDSGKRQKSDNYSSSTSLLHNLAVESSRYSVPVQRMVESLRLLGSSELPYSL